ncbi:MAG: hypothetical protein AMXMBFR13_49730 [Phycisphaerae bacterium]
MPYNDPDTTDPMTLHGVEIEVDGDEANREMAQCFIEEYLRIGFDGPEILRIFRTKGYAGPNMALHRLGEPTIRSMIEAEVGLRRPGAGRRCLSSANHRGCIPLPVLDDPARARDNE